VWSHWQQQHDGVWQSLPKFSLHSDYRLIMMIYWTEDKYQSFTCFVFLKNCVQIWLNQSLGGGVALLNQKMNAMPKRAIGNEAGLLAAGLFGRFLTSADVFNTMEVEPIKVRFNSDLCEINSPMICSPLK